MKCKHCGALLDKPSEFCPVCGNKLTNEEKDEKTALPSAKKKSKENKNPSLRMPDSTNRKLRENRNDIKTPANKKSPIELVQDKVYLNKDLVEKEGDYFIEEDGPRPIDKALSEKISRLVEPRDRVSENITLSSAIRDSQKKYRKIDGDRPLDEFKDRNVGDIYQKQEALEAPDKSYEEPKEKPIKAKKPRKAKKKSTKPNKTKFAIIGLIGVLIALILGLLYIKKKNVDYVSLDLASYISVDYEGEDGYAKPQARIDTDQLVADFANTVVYTSRDNNKDSYTTPAHELAADIDTNVRFQYSKDMGLSNGDEITIMANLDGINIADKYNVNITNASKAVIVEGIAGETYGEDAVDPFSYIDIGFEGESPNMTTDISLRDDAPEYMHTLDIVPSKTSEIEEGEEITISLNYDKESLKDAYGVVLSPTSKTVTASKEESADDDSIYIKSTANLSDDMLAELKDEAGRLIEDTILYKDIISIDSINYLGSVTGHKEDGNRVFLAYEVKTSESLPDQNYAGDFSYYTFVEYQNVLREKDSDGKFYENGSMTTDNKIYHKFFVESEYKYYQIEYQGFGFIDQALGHIGSALEGYDIKEENEADIKDHFAVSDSIAGEYEADGQRLSLKEDGSLVYQVGEAVHQGSYQTDSSEVSAVIRGVNVDNPISFSYEDGRLIAPDQGEFRASEFVKIENF